MRADAARNREKVLVAARELFAEQGFDVPLDEIAAKAGVGPGTVYRHFPTKQALFQAVTEARVSAMIASAEPSADAGADLFAFLGKMADEATAKRDMSDAIAVPSELRDSLHATLGGLLARAQEAGAVRADITTRDLVALMKGMLQSMHEGANPAVLLEIVLSGLQSSRKP
ncbi:TetR/AcrR family transcriptional regulator [Lentzea flaviverrucosa]|uniref:Transcriptional regulator, TetR family n=1 Tax=Lentzea flaviverrucosa TaxID=200379 RepID=A0A1H9WAZ0_9PSEU|nr:helix-turn-helix domain-containing protein [Lentzea flaviverrucosa]RDI22235.1 TetR family transcriptional regulator [Lentzea flaviverrucosa]SES31078.1 transcriptional regulator, TetR family [Lentzea flaviverrucosa]